MKIPKEFLPKPKKRLRVKCDLCGEMFEGEARYIHRRRKINKGGFVYCSVRCGMIARHNLRWDKEFAEIEARTGKVVARKDEEYLNETKYEDCIE